MEKNRESRIAYYKAWRESNPERIAAYTKKYRERQGSRREYYWKHRYGMTSDEYTKKLKEQLGLCAICNQLMDVPHIDHNHRTGKNRDLLCNNCNRGLGFLHDDVNILSSAIAYLQKHK